ncbi:hypothetical protein FOA52_009699 [Chlamydomonas sp. UWO 241]|nr:hypothetical protein FOA52_009699 [Chlamydomonas sp. UWO 241]
MLVLTMVRWPDAASPSPTSVEVLPAEDGGLNPLMEGQVFEGAYSSEGSSTGDGDSGFRKDANDVLVKDGATRLVELLHGAEPTPINGLYRFQDYYQDIIRYYEQSDASEMGVSSGWSNLDPYYLVVPGELTIITGVPNSGKSEWIDALLTNLAKRLHWCFAMCSLEKKPRDHAKQLLEKVVGKPFFQYIYEPRERMTLEELDNGLEFVQDHFHVIQALDDDPPTIDWVLGVARMAVMRHGIRGLVIDPYNELDHARPPYMQETEYVSHMLSKVKRFAQMYGVHVWFVAHPRQLHNWHGEPPSLYDISGSANFINKADNGIVIHRMNPTTGADKQHMGGQQGGRGGGGRGGEGGGGNFGGGSAVGGVVTKTDERRVHVLVRKVRNKAAGRIGQAVLEYDRPTGRYSVPQEAVNLGGPGGSR